MTGPERKHAVGRRLTIRWPGGPHDFQIEYYDDGPGVQPPPSPGHQYIRGVVVKPYDGTMRTFYVQPIGDDEYSLMKLPDPTKVSPRP